MRRAWQQTLAPAAVTLAVASGAVLPGCRPPGGGSGALAALSSPAPCGLPADRPTGEEELGVALAFSDPGAPADLEAMAALVAAHGGGGPVQLDGVTSRDGVAAAAAAVGRPGCRRAPAHRIEVDPRAARVTFWSAGPIVSQKLASADRHGQAREFPEARAAIQTAAAHDRRSLPGGWLAVGDSYLAERRWPQAEAAYQQATQQFPYAAEAWAGLGRARRSDGRRIQAVPASSRALALSPGDGLTRGELTDDPFVKIVAPVLPPAVLGPTGWRLVPGPERPDGDPFVRAEAQAYAGCREAFRRSAELRQQVTGRSLPQLRWSPAEESACSLMWLRVYLRHRGEGRAADAGLDDLVEIARAGLLDERALHDVAALADPRLLWLLPADRRARLFSFVEQYRVVPREDAGFMSPF